jgi:hypothetical protein
MRLDSTTLTLEGLAHASRLAGQLDRAAALYAELARAPQFGWEGQEHWRMARYHLACVDELGGRTGASAEGLRSFLGSWERASADLVPVREARAYFARLERDSGRPPGDAAVSDAPLPRTTCRL